MPVDLWPESARSAHRTLTGTATLRELEVTATVGELTLQLPDGPIVLRRTR
ncbi:hypothetical protein GPX89_06310 [Nocardia sp. ET3-3]|uniref:Uncharacterized protein n=1 Tax=Nocardia terrae TaxID=2675851 RepID=A0A7K1URS8_9NOCA|nr:hypothetical protein [Nocardia terrae]MVU76859.1 hypothetical protein [Nocardia terrae]